jgi:sugar (pentulose or hexulose) kinase
MKVIGIDLGTTFLKGAILDLDAHTLNHIHREPFPDAVTGLPATRFEVDAMAIVSATRRLIAHLLIADPTAQAILMSSQMHGLVLADLQGKSHSNAITWRDQRVTEPHPGGKGNNFDTLKALLTDDEIQQLGNELRPGLPIGALYCLAQDPASVIHQPSIVPMTLPDFVVSNLSGMIVASEPTNATAHGLMHLAKGDWHWRVIEKLGLQRLHWQAIAKTGQVVGAYKDETTGAQLPVYTPIGDQQCALYGVAIQPGELSINISTGSQVGLLAKDTAPGSYQLRPYFDGHWLRTITHVPAGRALNVLINFITEFAKTAPNADPDHVDKAIWQYIALAMAHTPSTNLKVNLGFFAAAGGGGMISQIDESNLSIGHVFCAAFEHMTERYAECALRLDPTNDYTRIAFSGGLAQNLPVLRKMISAKLGKPYRLSEHSEDVLLGLLNLGNVWLRQKT